MIRRDFAFTCVVLASCCMVGCSEPQMPELTPVQGVLLLDGKPLPMADIRFQPVATAALPPDAIGQAVTDAEGRFTLTTAGKPGALIGEHIVTVAEGPPPAEVRGDGPEAQVAAASYEKSLTNRPIPRDFATAASSTCKVVVKAGQAQYEISIRR